MCLYHSLDRKNEKSPHEWEKGQDKITLHHKKDIMRINDEGRNFSFWTAVTLSVYDGIGFLLSDTDCRFAGAVLCMLGYPGCVSIVVYEYVYYSF